MFKLIAILSLLFAVSALQISKPEIQKINADKELCTTCVSLMGDALNELIEIILDGGVLGSCGDICKKLPAQLEQVACDLICDYVGIDEFIKVLQYEDPDPIFICEKFDVCPTTKGKVAITNTFVSPTKGQIGTTFEITMDYTVQKATGTGLTTVNILPPVGFPIGTGELVVGQAVGNYRVSWKIEAKQSENEPFVAGLYPVFVAVCDGDCSTKHEWGGVYAQSKTNFTITQ